MALNDRAADGQPDAHALALGRVKGIEEALDVTRLHPGSRVAYRKTDFTPPAAARDDRQMPTSVINGAHRVRRVQHQIEDDLLKLYPITPNLGQVLIKTRPNHYSRTLESAAGEREYFSRGLVQIDLFGGGALSRKHRS